ncbi:hypothetical protein AMATHDRAFT_77093 [Amanita thiersii Skay4041]|uniref:NADH:flavin oxidoreductase/NADH oxidase N-terminal domain-containing protein n=1 Tax=Amanita thiersii Skay4041 TaxID=703135 RepID=A0A2A9NIX0_9AGAR|nr:hypothetical protein AMATHDRAFT_77093 [Amanita thiersii Skay4041]
MVQTGTIDQFLQDVSNKRQDEYGGSLEKRNAVVEAVGAERVGIRLSPRGQFQGMGMTNPIPQYAHFVSTLCQKHPKLAYLHVIEARVGGDNPGSHDGPFCVLESNDFLRAIWSPLPFISAGRYDKESALQRAEESGDLVAFGKHFIANPDLPIRLMSNIPLNPYDRKTFYVPGDQKGSDVGYIDYPFASETIDEAKVSIARI